MTRSVLIGLAALGLAIVGLAYAQQSATQPQATPELSRLRQQLQQSIKATQQGTKQQKATGTAAAAGAAADAPAPRGANAPKATDRPGGAQVVTGGADQAGALGARGAKNAAGGLQPGGLQGAKGGKSGQGGAGNASPVVRTLGANTYDPIVEMNMEYGPVPDVGEPMTLNGPLAVKEFLETLSMATNWNVIVTDEAQKVNLQFWITETKPSDALEILKFHDIYFEYEEAAKFLRVMTKVEYLNKKYGALEEYEVEVKHTTPDYMESLIGSLMSPKGRAVTDPRTGHIYVWDTQSNIDKMREAVEKLDVRQCEAEFAVKHADVADMETILNTLLSPSGMLVSDQRTARILVRDSEDTIAQMTSAVERFDVPIEAKIFPIKYANVDTLTDSVESVLSTRGKAQVDPHTNTLIVTDVPARQEMVSELVAALDRKLDTRTWVLNYIDAETVADRLENLVPEEMGDISVDDDVHQLTVTALVERLDEIETLIKSWDVKRRQVQIEAYIAQMSSVLARNLSISWTFMDSTGNAPQALQINGGAKPDYTSQANTLTVGQLAYPVYLRNAAGEIIKDVNGNSVIEKFSGNRVGAILNYLDTRNEARVIAAPRVTVQDGEEAIFQNGRRVPYVTSTSYGSSYPYSSYPSSSTISSSTSSYYNYSYGYNSQPYNRIDFIEVGTILNVMPRITEDNSILLDIAAEDSDATMTIVKSNGQDNTVPEKTESRAETQVRVKDGETIVIGGLRKGNDTRSLSKSLPILSDLPILGRLFNNPKKNINNATLMIFITTTIVNEDTQPETEHLAQFDDDFSADLRKVKKSGLKGAERALARGRNEIVVAVGQSGAIRSEGKRVGIDDLARSFGNVSMPGMTTVVVRKHLRAPEEVIQKITDLALEHRMKVEFDSDASAFVPNLPSAKAAEPAPRAQEPAAPEAAKPEAPPASPPAPAPEAVVPKPEMAPTTEDAKPAETPAAK